MRKKSRFLLVTLVILASLGFYFVSREAKSEVVTNQQRSVDISSFKSVINSKLMDNQLINSDSLQVGDNNLVLDKTINEELNKFVKSRIKYYRPDMVAVVVMDNDNGNILSSVGFDRSTMTFNEYLPFTGTHPSASLFKIVTTAELLRDGDVNPNSEFEFRGKGTTLYKSQLKEGNNRWTRKTNFERAFAMSNNVVFGKAAIENTTPVELKEMADKLGFNQDLMNEINLSKSNFVMPESGYNLAEMASGFNTDTTISPVHCAMLSSVVANDGKLVYPRLITKIYDKENKVIWENPIRTKKVIEKEINEELKELMQATIQEGTARKKFRKVKRTIKENIEIGGKTGSITGGLPNGKRDWFTSYAKPKESNDPGISVCVMNINFKKWYVKSTKIAEEIIQYYYTKIKKLE